jgi:hypothetical protein
VRVLGRAVFVDRSADLHELVVELALPGGAVADEDDLLAGLRVDGALVGAEHHVDARHLGVALGVEEPQDLDGLLDGAGAAAPAVVGLLALGRRARVGRDVRALEVLLHADEAHLEALRAGRASSR